MRKHLCRQANMNKLWLYVNLFISTGVATLALCISFVAPLVESLDDLSSESRKLWNLIKVPSRHARSRKIVLKEYRVD